MFITHQSVGLSDAGRGPAGNPSGPPAGSSGLVWEIDCSSRIRKGGVATHAACSQVHSKPLRTQVRRQLGCSPLGSVNADAAEVSNPELVGNAGHHVNGKLNQPGTKEGRPVPRDPNVVGFVPAFIVGNIYVCKVPERDSKAKSADADNINEEDAAPRVGRYEHPRPASLSLLMAMGRLGPASGVVGLFASKAAALLVARETYQQQKLTAHGNAEEPVGRLRQGLTETMTKWRASGIARQASHWKNFWTRDLKTDADLRSDILRSIKRAQSALLQAQGIMKQIDEATEELLMQEQSVLPMPLAQGLDMVMNRPHNVRLMDFPWRGKGTGLPSRTGKKRKGSSRQSEGTVTDGIGPGMATYTIPGISFTMPSSVGPLQFSPLFTSRHTAEIAWEVAREALLTRGIQRRKLKRLSERNATEMGAARLTGLASRVETQGSNEDEEGLGEPSEMAEFLNELGEGDPRSSKSNSKFRPRGPLDFLGALACGSVSLFARAVEWSGNTADHLLVHSPLGQRAVEMAKCPAIKEQPLHTAIAHARDTNRAKQQVPGLAQALAQQQDAHALLRQYLGLSSAPGLPSSSTAGGAQRAQQGNAAERTPGSASSSQQQASGSADDQRTQHAQQGQKFESAEAKRAQQDAGAAAEQLSGKAGEGKSGQPDKASPRQHDGDHPQHHGDHPQHHGDHSQHHGDHAQLNGDSVQAAQQAADAQASTSTLDSTDSTGSSRQHSATPLHGTPPKPGSPRGPQPDNPQHEPANSAANPHSPDSTPPFATSSTKQDHPSDPQSTTANGSHTEPQPSVASQQQPGNVVQAQDPVQDVLALQGTQGLPAILPPTDNLRCMLGNGEQVSMLDGLQALVTGFTIEMLTNKQDKLQFPMEIPIISLKGDDVVDEMSAANTAKASIHFDMAVASGTRSAVKNDSRAEWPAAEAVVLVGDIGFEQYKSASEYLKSKQKPGHAHELGEASVGYGNLSPLVGIIEEQQQRDAQDP